MLLYLARHAQTASSAVDSFNGQRELPLTEHGREQARKLGQRLAGVRFAAVYRSPLGRTAETAALIATRIPAQVVPGLIEISGHLVETVVQFLVNPAHAGIHLKNRGGVADDIVRRSLLIGFAQFGVIFLDRSDFRLEGAGESRRFQ